MDPSLGFLRVTDTIRARRAEFFNSRLAWVLLWSRIIVHSFPPRSANILIGDERGMRTAQLPLVRTLIAVIVSVGTWRSGKAQEDDSFPVAQSSNVHVA